MIYIYIADLWLLAAYNLGEQISVMQHKMV